jgi:serine/threonine-protein kinase
MSSATDASRAMRRSMAMEPSSAPHLAPGTVIAGRYRVLEVIGEGGMGTVYRAEQPALRRQVALKVVRPELSADASMVARFEREAYASSRITSPHVVVVHDFGRDESGVLYLIMELLEGESLATRMEREGALSVSRSLAICRDVARALEVAHAAGIVHRDLKPDNVFLTTQGDVKVLDFGIARIVEGPGGSTVGNATMTGMIVGTPVYMSPEAITRAPVGPPTDLYALGVMLYEMLAGQPPFMAEEAVLLMSQHLTALPQPLEKLVPSLAKKPAVLALVRRLLAKDPTQRGDTRTTSIELAKLAKQYGDTSQAELDELRVGTTPMSVPPRATSRTGVVVAMLAALLVLGGLAVGALTLLGPPDTAPTPIETSVVPATTLAAPAPPSTTIAPPETALPAPPETAPSETAPETTPTPTPVVVTLAGLPEGAVIESPEATIDGATLRFGRESGVHTVTVRAEGFEPVTLDVDTREDSTREVAMTRVRRRVERRGGETPATGATGSESGTAMGGLRREF